MSLAAQGAAVLAGGTRLLAADRELPNVLDLLGLGLSGLARQDEDLEIGAMSTLQEVASSPLADAASASLLPLAIRSGVPSRLLRGMATIGGEAIAAGADSELQAALLALNAVFLIATREGRIEIPALRFLRDPGADLGAGALLSAILVPGAPDGAALERAAALPSAPPIVAVAATASFSGDRLARVRLAITGLLGRPARCVEAEAHLERTAGEPAALEGAADLLARLSPFRDDAQASAGHRRRMARPLALRALRTAIERGRTRGLRETPRVIGATMASRAPAPMPYFTSGRLELNVNGRALRTDVDARTTLLELLRNTGSFGVKAGCGLGRCGACTVLLDGRPVAACLTLAVRAQGRALLTVEGLGTPERPHALQVAFAEPGVAQCGFCTPAQVLSARALLEGTPDPGSAEATEALTALCRCTGYARPVAAVLAAARKRP